MQKWSDLFRGPISLSNKMLQLKGNRSEVSGWHRVRKFQHQIPLWSFPSKTHGKERFHPKPRLKTDSGVKSGMAGNFVAHKE